ncbi:MAG: iron-containing alcohol dehydrogenase, partial [Sedimentisphaerales bacterium]|nr:iron-containing alcohol dehydrogenase [Sedimentisphaerales bacterium]
MNNFTYYNPTRIVFGKGVIDNAGSELNRSGAKKVMLVYGKKSLKENGIFSKITTSLNNAGIEYIEYGDVSGNPLLTHARMGIELARRNDIDHILAAGGGSVIDEAKAIAAGVHANCDIWDFYSKKSFPDKIVPLSAILTLPATGSEMNGISVLTNEQTQEKIAWVCPGLLNPQVSFLDPETTYTLPAQQTAYACVDIMSHVMEAYLTAPEESIIQDHLAQSVILSTMSAMDRIMHDPCDYQARATFMWCSTLAWNGIIQAGISGWGMPCHALEMPMSAVYDMPHGAGLSIIIPAWIALAGNKHQQRVELFAEKIFGLKTTNMAEISERLKQYYRTINAPVTFKESLAEEPNIKRLARLAYSSFVQRGVSGYDLPLIET